LSQALRPVLAIAKPRRLAYATGEAARAGRLPVQRHRQAGGGRGDGQPGLARRRRDAGRRWSAPAQTPDQFSYLLAENVETPPLAREGSHRLRVVVAGVVSERELWVDRAGAVPRRPLRLGVSGVARSLRDQLRATPGVVVEDFKPGVRYDGIVASGLKSDEIARRQVGEETGLEAQPKKGEKPVLVLGELPPEVLAAVRSGTPLLAMVQEDGLAEGVARQLSSLGLFDYAGQVGGLRAPWMGNWNYVRAHPTFAGVPVDMGLSVLHQVEGQPSNGLLVDGEGVEVIAAYSRDHDRKNGAASLIARKDGMRVLVHRLPDMVAPLQARWLANAVDWLGQGG
jgi:beta-galactosidase